MGGRAKAQQQQQLTFQVSPAVSQETANTDDVNTVKSEERQTTQKTLIIKMKSDLRIPRRPNPTTTVGSQSNSSDQHSESVKVEGESDRFVDDDSVADKVPRRAAKCESKKETKKETKEETKKETKEESGQSRGDRIPKRGGGGTQNGGGTKSGGSVPSAAVVSRKAATTTKEETALIELPEETNHQMNLWEDRSNETWNQSGEDKNEEVDTASPMTDVDEAVTTPRVERSRSPNGSLGSLAAGTDEYQPGDKTTSTSMCKEEELAESTQSAVVNQKVNQKAERRFGEYSSFSQRKRPRSSSSSRSSETDDREDKIKRQVLTVVGPSSLR